MCDCDAYDRPAVFPCRAFDPPHRIAPPLYASLCFAQHRTEGPHAGPFSLQITMSPTAAELLAHRHRVPDATLLDWLDLAQMVEPPCVVATEDLMRHWHCSQPSVSRRLSRLWEARLLDYRPSRGAYRIRRLGPIVTDCDGQAA